MWPESIKDKIAFELESIEREMLATERLFAKLRRFDPDNVEIRAAASTLHAFYNGVENIFSAIARQIDGLFPGDDRWHLSLLRSMSELSGKRQSVVTEPLRKSLEKYLAFRHFYRHSYGFVLDWKQIKPLCDDLHETYTRFKNEISNFLGSRPMP